MDNNTQKDASESERPAWYDNRSSVYSLSIGSGVTGIGSYAFAGFARMTSLDLGVTFIALLHYVDSVVAVSGS